MPGKPDSEPRSRTVPVPVVTGVAGLCAAAALAVAVGSSPILGGVLLAGIAFLGYSLRSVYLDLQTLQHDAEARQKRLKGVKSYLERSLKSSEQQRWKLFQAKGEAEENAAEAAKADEAKSAFLATMSHELRTPMNAVIGMGSVLETTDLTAEQEECVTTIRSSGNALLSIINDILDFSKIELERESFEIDACLDTVKNLLTHASEEKGLELSWSRALDVPAWILGDVSRLQQILTNLVNNAIKLTDSGSVTLRVELGRKEGARLALHFTVQDTGVGISQEGLDGLFRPFSQADASISRKHGGTGLGLAISKRFAEIMGGQMWVESEVGTGSTFHFTIESAEGEAKAAKTATTTPTWDDSGEAADLRILIAEDNSINQKVAVKILEKLGYQADVAGNGLEALDALERQPCDVVLMDMQMPEMDGLEASRRIRSKYPSELRPYIIALTANAMKEDRDLCREAGMDDFLSKPFTAHMIGQLLSQCPRHEGGRPLDELPAGTDAG